MKQLTIFLTALVLACLALVPAAARADSLEDLEVTMEVFDDIGDLDEEVSEMDGPRNRDIQAGEEELEIELPEEYEPVAEQDTERDLVAEYEEDLENERDREKRREIEANARDEVGADFEGDRDFEQEIDLMREDDFLEEGGEHLDLDQYDEIDPYDDMDDMGGEEELVEETEGDVM